MMTPYEAELLYHRYFVEFRDYAPKEYLAYGGYYTGLPNTQASSWESCVAFAALFQENDTLLNAGAGLSSWMFRHMHKHVACTDPDQGYLKAVEIVVGGQGYIHGLDNCPQSDFVYYDYGNAERVPMLAKAYSLARKAMYVDDCHDLVLAQCVRDLAVATDSDLSEPVGLDKEGRFGLIIRRRQPMTETH